MTPNFDDFLAGALRIFGKHHLACDHPATTTRLAAVERGELQIVHVHGTYSFYDCKNLGGEITAAARPSTESVGTMAAFLDYILMTRSPIVVGYGGWEEDVLMRALKRRLVVAGLPTNIYWFCRTRRQPDGLPRWLRDDEGLRFVVPDEIVPMATSPGRPGEAWAERFDAEPAPMVTAEAVGPDEKPTLDAYAVFDEFNRAFGFPSPRVTREPLRFFAAQLRATLPSEDLQGGKQDIYGLRDVVERIELAVKASDVAGPRADGALAPIEAMREAIRRSDYVNALAAGKSIAIAAVSESVRKELFQMFASIADGLLDNSMEELAAYDLALRIEASMAAPSRRVSHAVARLLVNKGITLSQLNRIEAPAPR